MTSRFEADFLADMQSGYGDPGALAEDSCGALDVQRAADEVGPLLRNTLADTEGMQPSELEEITGRPFVEE